jgi:putative heme-binding domain-containing protein
MLSARDTSRKQRLFLFDTIDRCAVAQLPAPWIESFRAHLQGTDAVLRERVLSLVRTRQLASLDPELEAIASRDSESPELRVIALGALAPRRSPLPEASYRFLLSLLGPETSADLRQSAAQVLGHVRWTEAQLLLLSKQHLPNADPLILPHLLDAYESARSSEVGKTMVAGLMQSKSSGEGIAAARIPALLKNFPQEVHTAAKPLLSRIEQEKQSRVARLRELEPLLRQGDIDRGREIFFGKKAGCASCHTIMAEGSDVGPDLTGVGAVRSGFDLLEAIIYPSASFVPGHEVYRVETERDVYTGVRGEAAGDAVVIITGPRERIRIPRKDVRSMRPSPVSLMPDGFGTDLTRQELADLLAFLQAQKSRTEPQTRLLSRSD